MDTSAINALLVCHQGVGGGGRGQCANLRGNFDAMVECFDVEVRTCYNDMPSKW